MPIGIYKREKYLDLSEEELNRVYESFDSGEKMGQIAKRYSEILKRTITIGNVNIWLRKHETLEMAGRLKSLK